MSNPQFENTADLLNKKQWESPKVNVISMSSINMGALNEGGDVSSLAS